MEYIKEEHERTKMQRHIVNAFLSSPIVTELNKNNLIDLVGKISDNKISEFENILRPSVLRGLAVTVCGVEVTIYPQCG